MTIVITPQFKDDVPTFDGVAIFGPNAGFTVQLLGPWAAGPAAAIDNFLGLTPGTTQYGGNGKLWGITGQLVDSSADAVAADQAALLAFAGITAPFGRPTNEKYPADFIVETKPCYFVAAEFIPAEAGIVAIGGGQYGLNYSMVIRELPSR